MTSSPRPTTPLRQRMIEDRKLRNLSPHTVLAYVDRVVGFAKHFGRSPHLSGSNWPGQIRAARKAVDGAGSLSDPEPGQCRACSEPEGQLRAGSVVSG